ncbi:MAG: BON domain-containing protein [Pigmentiphaga sp.]
MMFKLSHLRLALASLALAILAACGSTDDNRGVANYADDAGITARVRLALVQHPVWRQADLQVSTQSGVVRLTGQVPEDHDPGQLGALVAGIDGVLGVTNDVR